MSHFYFAVALAPLALLALLAVLYSPGPGPSPGHQGPDVHPLPLPDDLLIGAGTSAVQTEGAWDEDGKSESVLDYILHTGRLESAGFQAAHEHDRGADSYHRYKEDVAKAAELKLQVYRFSISWARVLPEADASKPNAKGVQFYHNLIDEILAHNMKPMVVLYHFDHPQLLEREFNGWRGRRMVDKFREYATFIFKEYGHKVKMWTSLNEPDVYCTYMLGLQRTIGELAPAEAEDPLPCVHHFLLAHGEASRALRETGNGGSIGLSVSSLIARPNSTRPEDAHAAETFNELFQGIMLHPVVFGDYPPVVKQLVGDKLPVFTLEEKAMLANSSDHIGITVYYGMVASYRPPGAPTGKGIFLALKQLLKYLDFVNVAYVSSNGSVAYSFPYDSIVPDIMRAGLLWPWIRYKKPIIVTENGMGGSGASGTQDQRRASYFSAFLRALVTTVKEFGVRVPAYCAWSLIDSWEWSAGYKRNFGLVHVDIAGGSYNRSLKDSSQFWIELAKQRAVPAIDVPSGSHENSKSSISGTPFYSQ